MNSMSEHNFNPPDWSYNPSAWPERLPIIVLSVVGFIIAAYLAAFQFEIISTAWDPFFGNGTELILTSSISEAFPIPDAALGALGYLTDAVTGSIGGRKRWRTMPWIVILFGLAVGPLGAVSIVLVMLQPVVVGEWCTLCLTTAAISVVMIGPALDETLASLQYLKRISLDNQRSLWKAFWGFDSRPITNVPSLHASEEGT
jgi:hypothetical protein